MAPSGARTNKTKGGLSRETAFAMVFKRAKSAGHHAMAATASYIDTSDGVIGHDRQARCLI